MRRTGLTMRHGVMALAGVVAAITLASACAPQTPPTIRPTFTATSPNRTVTPSAGCSAATVPPAGRTMATIVSDGLVRTYFLTIPASATPGTAAPLLVSFHPFVLPPDVWEAYSGLADAAAARGYVVVTPLGSDPGPRWAVPGGLEGGPDDLAFINRLIDRIENDLCVDTGHVFAAGFSAGAAMAEAEGCQPATRFRAIAASSGANLTSLCPTAPGIDSLYLHGTADTFAPLTGSEVVFAPPLGLHLSDVVAGAAARAGCDAEPVSTTAGSTIDRHRYVNCAGGKRVELWLEVGAGHTWAGSALNLPEGITGVTDTEFSATTAVLDFFDTAN